MRLRSQKINRKERKERKGEKKFLRALAPPAPLAVHREREREREGERAGLFSTIDTGGRRPGARPPR